jgi:predicted ATP-grasp superfamily ATP-dependent carboligase
LSDAHDDSIPALVVGNGLTALGIMRSLGRKGIPLYNLNPQPDYVSASRYFNPAPPSWGTLKDGEGLAAYLERLPLKRAVLFAGNDDRVKEASALNGALGARIGRSISPADTIHALLDKLSLAKLLVDRDLPHPRTFDLSRENALDEVPEDVFESSFLKPRDSLAFNRFYKAKAFRVASRDEARTRLKKITSDGFSMILQEYIPGDASDHYFVDGFIDRAGSFRGIFARRRKRMYPVDFGDSSSMTSVSLTTVPGAVSTVERLLPDLRYRGIFSAEFKQDPRDGLFKLLEVNCRPWWFNGFAADCGVDTTLMAYRDALELPVEPVTRYKEHVKLVSSFNDLRASYGLYRKSQLRPSEALRFWAGAKDAFFSWDDPMPWFRNVLDQVTTTAGSAVSRKQKES